MPLFQQTITNNTASRLPNENFAGEVSIRDSFRNTNTLIWKQFDDDLVREFFYCSLSLPLRKIPRKPPIWYAVQAYRKLRFFSTPVIANFWRSGRDLAEGWISGAEFASIAERAGIFSILFPLETLCTRDQKFVQIVGFLSFFLSFFSRQMYACHLILLHYLNLVCGDFRKKEKRLAVTPTQVDRVLPK